MKRNTKSSKPSRLWAGKGNIKEEELSSDESDQLQDEKDNTRVKDDSVVKIEEVCISNNMDILDNREQKQEELNGNSARKGMKREQEELNGNSARKSMIREQEQEQLRRDRIRQNMVREQDQEHEMAIESDDDASNNEEELTTVSIMTSHIQKEEFKPVIHTVKYIHQSQSESSDSESSEEESESESEVMLKPVFVSKANRQTIRSDLAKEIAQKEKTQKAEHDSSIKKLESHLMAAEEIKKELVEDNANETSVPDVDDTDGLDEEAEHLLWTLRELSRIKISKQAQCTRDDEIIDIERRRQLTDAEILAENDPVKEKERIKFLQKYYHKGAFYADDEIMSRDYNEATEYDEINKKSLPEIMQVKKFGLHGRTKWSHLTKEDTSTRDAAWSLNNEGNKRIQGMMGGMKSSFDLPQKKSRIE